MARVIPCYIGSSTRGKVQALVGTGECHPNKIPPPERKMAAVEALVVSRIHLDVVAATAT